MAAKQIVFIGAGNMAEGIARGIITQKIMAAADITACDPAAARREVFAGLGAKVSADNTPAYGAPVVLLAVKPQQIADVLKECGPHWGAGTLVVTIAAGVKTESVAAAAPGTRIVRVMPNLPMACGAGMSGVARGAGATAEDEKFVLSVFGAGGKAAAVAEKHLDAVTAVSGSGPAYVFLLAEILEKSARELGLPGEICETMARQTVIGAARLLETTDIPSGEWRARVTSKGGTTAAAVDHMLDNGIDRLIIEAVGKAAARSAELSALAK